MTEEKATSDKVYKALVELMDEGGSISADAILERMGVGNKGTVLKERGAALARLKEEGRETGPTTTFLAATDTLLRKLWTTVQQQANLAARQQVDGLHRVIEGMQHDLDKALDTEAHAVARADAADARLDQLLKSYDELNMAFRALANGLGASGDGQARPATASAREIAGVLNVLSRLPTPASHEQLYEAMIGEGWDKQAAHRARFRVVETGYAELTGLGITKRGRDWLDRQTTAG